MLTTVRLGISLQESDKQDMESGSCCHAIKLLLVYCLFMSIFPLKANRVQINKSKLQETKIYYQYRHRNITWLVSTFCLCSPPSKSLSSFPPKRNSFACLLVPRTIHEVLGRCICFARRLCKSLHLREAVGTSQYRL